MKLLSFLQARANFQPSLPDHSAPSDTVFMGFVWACAPCDVARNFMNR